MLSAPPTGGATDNGDQNRIFLVELLLLKSADLGLSKAIRGMSMKIELEDDCSYEIFTFIHHTFVSLLAAAFNLLVTSGTFKLGHAGKEKKGSLIASDSTRPHSLDILFICNVCFVVTRSTGEHIPDAADWSVLMAAPPPPASSSDR